MTALDHAVSPATRRVLRVEIRPKPGEIDAHGHATLGLAQTHLGPAVTAAHTTAVFLIEAPLTDEQSQQVAGELLSDPVNQVAVIGAEDAAPGSAVAEVHYLPGVMDPVAESTQDAIREMLPSLGKDEVQVRTGTRFDFETSSPIDDAKLRAFAESQLANTVVQSVHLEHYHPAEFVHGTPYDFNLTHIPIRDLDDAALEVMSREAHLFLSLDEMREIQNYYRDAGREPTDVELETLAQTWSEHCVHKTLKSTVSYTGSSESLDIFRGKAGHEVNDDGTVTIHNLLKTTVAAATFDLKDKWKGTDREDWLVSVFDDNAGIVKFDDTDGVAIKVETHNHPSALEPYGGAATGIGGCIRDIMGTGLAAKPIANTDTFCVAFPDADPEDLPNGVIHPKRTLQRVVDGVRDYGNRMGIPTVNGAVYFHDDFVANPLVYAGCVGIIPLDKCFGTAQPGDRIIILGGATGRDGIHGATFSSAELTDTHADEFSHAVQIGNAITEKKTLDVILQARDYVDPQTNEARCLFTAISDCGAGGFSSAVGEMAEKVGAKVTLDTAPTKYDGLTYTEVWISEAQERMPLAVPAENVEALRQLAEAEDVPFCDLGEFGYEEDGVPTLQLTWHGQEVGKLAMPFMHDGIPTPTRQATWPAATSDESAVNSDEWKGNASAALGTVHSSLVTLLSHPNLASKHWIIRQYDHEVQAGSVVKPLVGPGQDGPSDGAVLRPKLDSNKGVSLSNGLAPYLSEKATADGTATDGDSYWATLAALDEAVRNAVCVGADPRHLAILDNFCWPRCDDPAQLGSLVRAAEACYDGAMAYETPFVSGKDSLSNQFTTEDGKLITIPPTMLISAMGMVDDITKARTMDAKAAGNALLVVGNTTPNLGGSHLAACGLAPATADRRIPRVDLEAGPKHAAAVAALIDQRLVASAHDCSEGGLLPAAAEMAFAGRIGLDLDLTNLPAASGTELDLTAKCFAETPSRYLLEIEPGKLDAAIKSLRDAGIPFAQVGTFTNHDDLTLRTADQGQLFAASLDELREAWLKPLDW
ncbi:phosphoribosylformylglycinamidine synthase subunit PurS [Algisphaera agarilytica]|uniref:Phosphoribosylformylglycinamidine synthase subunit PurL n=1 Tax=Algisphaera agarilytica TaxID=1385975 RepID=A0A7X0LJF4_9BACT|nr:phosphoribosylformylglycinamidine synthase subunit PurS [Algisphaera agarilytica]MBB6428551.1 phosphoribosylformylglycinamidine synthase [Algisphaera agarilytica]